MSNEQWEINEANDIITATNKFSLAMSKKMLIKLGAGYRGWNDYDNRENIIDALKKHIDKGFNEPKNMIDIANFLMMIYCFEIYEEDDYTKK